jgi:hypothetical protein
MLSRTTIFFKMMTFKHHPAHRPNIYHRADVRRGHGELDSRLSILFHFWSFCQKIEDIGLVNPPFLKGLDPEVFPYKLCSFVAGYYT